MAQARRRRPPGAAGARGAGPLQVVSWAVASLVVRDTSMVTRSHLGIVRVEGAYLFASIAPPSCPPLACEPPKAQREPPEGGPDPWARWLRWKKKRADSPHPEQALSSEWKQRHPCPQRTATVSADQCIVRRGHFIKRIANASRFYKKLNVLYTR